MTGMISFLAAVLTVQYVANASSDQFLDLYWPDKTPSATVLFIHGGSLQERGERRDSPAYRDVCKPSVAAAFSARDPTFLAIRDFIAHAARK